MVDYFEVKDPKDFWICRYVVKPHKKVLSQSKKSLLSNGVQLSIGVSKCLVNRIVTMYGQCNDMEIVSCRMELPKPLVRIVLQHKGMLK